MPLAFAIITNMLERIPRFRQIRELERQLGVSDETSKQLHREIFFKGPFVIARALIGALADAQRATEWLGPGAMPHESSFGHPGQSLGVNFDRDKFSIAIRELVDTPSGPDNIAPTV